MDYFKKKYAKIYPIGYGFKRNRTTAFYYKTSDEMLLEEMKTNFQYIVRHDSVGSVCEETKTAY